jgi:hypothetical protein
MSMAGGFSTDQSSNPGIPVAVGTTVFVGLDLGSGKAVCKGVSTVIGGVTGELQAVRTATTNKNKQRILLFSPRI